MPSKTHGMSRNGTKEYDAWKNMKARCYRESYAQYYDYGGRGIKVCDRWVNSFENFITDMGRRPTNQHSLDRIDNNGSYEPSNCRWATKTQQNLNQKVRRDSTSGIRGVSWSKTNKKWVVTLYYKKSLYLGSFVSKEEAAAAYSAGRLKYYGY